MLHKFLKTALILFLFTTVYSQINAQCAEIYFYRLNTLVQSDKVILLYQDGVEILNYLKKLKKYFF